MDQHILGQHALEVFQHAVGEMVHHRQLLFYPSSCEYFWTLSSGQRTPLEFAPQPCGLSYFSRTTRHTASTMSYHSPGGRSTKTQKADRGQMCGSRGVLAFR